MQRVYALVIVVSSLALIPGCSRAPMAPAATWEFPVNEPVTIAPERDGIRKYSGKTETMVEFPDGSVSAWSDGDAPQMHVGWPDSLEEHDRMARVYFLGHGIPEKEIGELFHFSGFTSGAAIGHPESVRTERLGFSTTFTRRVDGFKVLDSHAGVQLNTDRKPVALAISWPPVPPEALNDARVLRATLDRDWKPPEETMRGLRMIGTEVVLRYRAFNVKPSWNAVIRVEALSGPTMHTFVDLDEKGRRVETVDTSGARPSIRKVQPDYTPR